MGRRRVELLLSGPRLHHCRSGDAGRGVFWLIGAVGLTAVEQGMGLQEALPNAFKVMFATVFVMNIGHVINTLAYFKRKAA